MTTIVSLSAERSWKCFFLIASEKRNSEKWKRITFLLELFPRIHWCLTELVFSSAEFNRNVFSDGLSGECDEILPSYDTVNVRWNYFILYCFVIIFKSDENVRIWCLTVNWRSKRKVALNKSNSSWLRSRPSSNMASFIECLSVIGEYFWKLYRQCFTLLIRFHFNWLSHVIHGFKNTRDPWAARIFARLIHRSKFKEILLSSTSHQSWKKERFFSLFVPVESFLSFLFDRIRIGFVLFIEIKKQKRPSSWFIPLSFFVLKSSEKNETYANCCSLFLLARKTEVVDFVFHDFAVFLLWFSWRTTC